MKAFKCDACHRMFMIPVYRTDAEDFIPSIPGELYIYSAHGRTRSFDLCNKCLDIIVNKIDEIREENGQE